MVAATEKKDAKDEANAIFKTSEFRSGEDYIKGALSSPAKDGDIMGVGAQFDRQQRAAAILEFTQAAKDVKTPQELNAAREEIVGRYLKRKKEMPAKDQGADMAGLIRYSTPAETAAAARKGKLSEEELALHLKFFKAQRNAVR